MEGHSANKNKTIWKLPSVFVSWLESPGVKGDDAGLRRGQLRSTLDKIKICPAQVPVRLSKIFLKQAPAFGVDQAPAKSPFEL